MCNAVLLVATFVLLGQNAVRGKQHTEIPDFSTAVKSKHFVDKTLIAETMFSKPEKVLITGPPRCGKSTVIKMLKMFLEIQVDDEGLPVSKSVFTNHPVQYTSNYNFFAKNQFNITKRKYVMAKHFGKYPVIHIDFKCKHQITNSDNAVVCFRDIIHSSFLDHKYLRKSEKLTTKETRFLKKWCDYYGAYEKFYGQDVTNSLYKLVLILYKHFDSKKVFVLIDNYDFPSSSFVFEAKDSKELNRVVTFNMAILSKLLTADYKYLSRAVVLGTSYVVAAGIHGLIDVAAYKFLDDHPFNDYFSLLKPELYSLIETPEFIENKKTATTYSWYGGYLTKSGKIMYRISSVLRFLQSGEVKPYCPVSRIFKNLDRYFKIRLIRKTVENLVMGGSLILGPHKAFSLDEIISLRDVALRQRSLDQFNIDLLFVILLEQGYLSYALDNKNYNLSVLAIPNQEVNTLFSLKLKDYYDIVYILDKTRLGKCASFFENFSHQLTRSMKQVKIALYWFYKSFEELITSARSRFSKLSSQDIHRIIFSMIYEINARGKYPLYLKTNGTEKHTKVMMVKGDLLFNIEFKTNSTSKHVIEEMICNKQESMLPSNLNHITSIKSNIFLGLGIDEFLKPSLTYLFDAKNISKVIHIPELYE